MAWLSVNKDGVEILTKIKPYRDDDHWEACIEICGNYFHDDPIILPKGSIKEFIGKERYWWNEPYEI